ncbi:hypothetical protein Gohar_006674, partial [Gossypium harknessii]|nr:hypothetical protein [Gossypium harknessii]
MRDFFNAPNGLPKQSLPVSERHENDPSQSPLGGRTDVFDLPFHMARDQIEESLRTKMASVKERMVQLQDAQKGAEVTSEATERELELEAQLVEARSIIQEQVAKHPSCPNILPRQTDQGGNPLVVLGYNIRSLRSVSANQLKLVLLKRCAA